MKKVFLYDGTWKGFLSAAYAALQNPREDIAVTARTRNQHDLFIGQEAVRTDATTVGIMERWLREHLCDKTRRDLFRAWLADVSDKDEIIMFMLRLAAEIGPEVECHKHEEGVGRFQNLARAVGCEAHRMCGFVRFTQAGRAGLIARISPDHHVLPLIAPFFARRLKGRSWVILDVKRNWSAVSNGHDYRLTNTANTKSLHVQSVPNRGDHLEDLWRQYFKVIAIGPRKNSKAQMRSMPQRYWKHMPELFPEKN